MGTPKRKPVAASRRPVSRPKRRRTGVVAETIPTINRSTLRSSILPRSSSTGKERTIDVERGTTLIIHVV